MKKIICENKNKDKVKFTYDFPFFLETIDGLHSVIGTVTTVSSAFGIGESYSGTSIQKRPITITGIIKDNFEARRKTLYKIFPLKTEGTLYYYENEKDQGKKITYIVEDVEIDEKGMPRTFTISLICPNPYFKDLEESEVSMATWTPAFCFPMISEKDVGIEFATKNITTMGTITNETNIDLGTTIHFIAHGQVVNPYIVNVETQEQMLIEIEMAAGDEIVITTHRGNKKINLIEDSTKIPKDIIHFMKYGSKFLQMHSGVNTLRAGAKSNEENLETKVYYSNEYEAV